jgi:hypothetical protein
VYQVFLCIAVQGKKISGAFYSVETSELTLIPEVPFEFDDAAVDYVKRLKLQVQPSTIITSTQTPDILFDTMRESIGMSRAPDYYQIDHIPDSDGAQVAVEVLPAFAFQIPTCRKLILALQLPDMPDDQTPQERSMYIRGLIDLDQTGMV